MKKPRHNPDKKQNKYGGDYECPNYDTSSTGKEFCHDEGQAGWGEWVKWAQMDNEGCLMCKGNRHTCMKLRLHYLASLSTKEKKKFLSHV